MMRKLFLLCVVAVALVSRPAFTEQIFPDELHAMPVLINIPLADAMRSSFGTGFYLCESNRLFLITAAHCIFDPLSTNFFALINSNATISSFPAKDTFHGKNEFTLDLKLLSAEGRIKRHPSHDVAVVLLANQTTPYGDKTVMNNYVNGIRLPPPRFPLASYSANDTCEVFTNVPDGKEVFILGYPVELLKNEILSEVDFEFPLVRKGIISQSNRKTGKLIIDSGIYGGNSGGPVLVVQHPTPDVDAFKIVGLITQFVPVFTRMAPQANVTNSVMVNSGYGVAEPIDYALELMRQY